MRKKHDKSEIIKLGKALFREHGYTNTGVGQILEEADLSKGSFYNFFESKEDYARQVLDSYVSDQYAYVSNMLQAQDKSPLERIDSFYQSMIEFNREEQCEKGCLLANMTNEMGGLSEKISADSDRHFKSITGLLAKCINEGQVKNEITGRFEAHALADFIHNGFNGALLRAKAGRSTEPMEQFITMVIQMIKIRH